MQACVCVWGGGEILLLFKEKIISILAVNS